MNNQEQIKNGAAKNAWDLFTTTGEIGYYLLYKDLTGSNDSHADIRD